jgi:AcrR family transcriptional regulator
MAELAKRAGMSVGHIYHYFESRDAIVEALVDREMEQMRRAGESLRADDVVAEMIGRLDETVEHHLVRDNAALWLECSPRQSPDGCRASVSTGSPTG